MSTAEYGTTTLIPVSELVRDLQDLIEDNFVQVLVRGELGNLSQPTSGHRYFTLKDRYAQIRCVMFRSHARAMLFTPEEGMEVICRGRVSVYPQRGELQLIVEGLEPEGVGSLQLSFEQVRATLEAEGLFAESRKKPLPAFPETVGIVTSASGAAIMDILQILQRRAVGVTVLLRPVRVQGEGAAADIASGIADLNREGSADVIIVGRGGGSKEDLWAFNEEAVARAIAASQIPVISAVGHETDVTISDLTADLRAPTPSAAAELVVKNRLDLERHLDHLVLRLGRQMQWHLSLVKSRLHGLEKRLKSPAQRLRQQHIYLQQLRQRLNSGILYNCEKQTHRFEFLNGRLKALSPTAILERGYAIVQQNTRVITTSDQVSCNDDLSVTLAQGRLRVRVIASK